MTDLALPLPAALNIGGKIWYSFYAVDHVHLLD